MNVWSQYAGTDSVCICMEHWCCWRRFPQLTQTVPLFCSLPWLDLLLPPACPPAAMHLLMLGWAARPGLLDCSTQSDSSMKLTIWSHLWTDASGGARWTTHPTSTIAPLEACWRKLQQIFNVSIILRPVSINSIELLPSYKMLCWRNENTGCKKSK